MKPGRQRGTIVALVFLVFEALMDKRKKKMETKGSAGSGLAALEARLEPGSKMVGVAFTGFRVREIQQKFR